MWLISGPTPSLLCGQSATPSLAVHVSYGRSLTEQCLGCMGEDLPVETGVVKFPATLVILFCMIFSSISARILMLAVCKGGPPPSFLSPHFFSSPFYITG